LWSHSAFAAGSTACNGQIKQRSSGEAIVTAPAAVVRDLQPVSSGEDTRREDCDVGIREHGYGLFQAVNHHRGWDSSAKATAKNVHFNRFRVPGIESERHFIDHRNVLVIVGQ
jgi:hypothetical protein